jgi:hypothetical protein
VLNSGTPFPSAFLKTAKLKQVRNSVNQTGTEESEHREGQLEEVTSSTWAEWSCEITDPSIENLDLSNHRDEYL